MNGARISKLELENWMNFTKVEVELARRVFIIGPNACGKSNLLDSIRFLRDLVTEGGGLATAIQVRGSMKKVRSLYARQNPAVRVCATVDAGNGESWRYDLSITHKPPGTHRPQIEREVVEHTSRSGRRTSILSRPDDDDRHDPERLTQTAIQQVTANQDFRELVEFFRSISYLHAVPHLMREGQAAPSSTIGGDPYGRDLLNRIRSAPPRSQRSRLKRIENVLQVVVPQLKELTLVQDDQGRPHLQANFQHWRPFGAHQWETQFSDGTLRLIGLLWALQDKAGPLLLEEPELSLHSAIVRRLAPFISRAQHANERRQVLLSTHSVELLEDEGISSDEILVVAPGDNGSSVGTGAANRRISKLMASGITANEAALPMTTPASQMTLFDKLSP